jgi:LacI family transcriptional regulator
MLFGANAGACDRSSHSRSRQVKRPTIRDVAARAGVSHQTVSRVMNGNGNVAAGTRERVLQAIQELEYVPSALARGLSSDRTHTLGMVTADVSDYFFAQAVAGAEAEARKHGLFLVVGSVEAAAEDDERHYLRLMLERRVDGLIVAQPMLGPGTGSLLASLAERLPLVVMVARLRLPGVDLVDVDNRQGGLDATSFLIEQGHHAIATIAGPLGWPSARDRLASYRVALRRAGLPQVPALVERCPDWGLDSGRQATARLLATGSPFTAIFAQSDLLALGAITELRARGLRVPEDVSVVGYDDIPVASFVDPPLTTIRQPTRQVGAKAVEMLLDRIAAARSHTRHDPKRHLLRAELVIRQSAVPPS